MNPGTEADRSRALLKVWWILWAAILCTLVTVYGAVGLAKLPASAPHPNPFANLVGLVPLFVSIIIRWLVLPRYNEIRQAFPLFVAGLALAEGCGFLGIFLGGPYRDDLFALGVLGIVQFVPFFAKSYLEPRPQGFIPNN